MLTQPSFSIPGGEVCRAMEGKTQPTLMPWPVYSGFGIWHPLAGPNLVRGCAQGAGQGIE